MQDWEKLWSAGTYNVRYPNENVIRFVMRYCRDTGLKILDVGCGCGNNFMPVVDLECIPVGVDISQYALDRAAENYPSSELYRYEFGNKLPLPDLYVDHAYDRSSLTCVKIKEIKKTLQEVNRVLKETGYFYISLLSDESDFFRAGVDDGSGYVSESTDSNVKNAQQFRGYTFLGFAEAKRLLSQCGFEIHEYQKDSLKFHLADTSSRTQVVHCFTLKKA